MTLAATEAAQAPDQELALDRDVAMPERSEMMPAKAPSEIGAASSRVPASTPVMLAVLPASSVGQRRRRPRTAGRRAARAATGRWRRGRAGRCPTRPRDDAGDDPDGARRWSRRSARRPPWLSIQNENVGRRRRTALSESCSANSPRAARMTPRMRAARRARCARRRWPRPRPARTVGVAAVMRPPPSATPASSAAAMRLRSNR